MELPLFTYKCDVLYCMLELKSKLFTEKKNLLKPTLGKANVLIVKFPKSFRYVYEKDQWLKGVFANLFYRKGLCGKEHFTYKNYMSLCVTLADACLIWKQIWTSLVSSDLLIYINITEGVLLDETLQLIW